MNPIAKSIGAGPLSFTSLSFAGCGSEAVPIEMTRDAITGHRLTPEQQKTVQRVEALIKDPEVQWSRKEQDVYHGFMVGRVSTITYQTTDQELRYILSMTKMGSDKAYELDVVGLDGVVLPANLGQVRINDNDIHSVATDLYKELDSAQDPIRRL